MKTCPVIKSKCIKKKCEWWIKDDDTGSHCIVKSINVSLKLCWSTLCDIEVEINELKNP